MLSYRSDGQSVRPGFGNVGTQLGLMAGVHPTDAPARNRPITNQTPFNDPVACHDSYFYLLPSCPAAGRRTQKAILSPVISSGILMFINNLHYPYLPVVDAYEQLQMRSNLHHMA